jgi:NTP pyrophosphatase (non-canonical NTP hydrolase)
MTREERNAIYDMAVDKFGRDKQLVVAMEELAELQVEIAHFMRSRGNKKNLMEEMADVLIMLEQVERMAGIDNADVLAVGHKKIERLRERLTQ